MSTKGPAELKCDDSEYQENNCKWENLPWAVPVAGNKCDTSVWLAFFLG